MLIKTFDLHNFRNYGYQKIEFQKGINLLVGSNGQGKTNILEGINYLLTGKSYRVRHESELIKWGEKGFYLQASCTAADRLIKLESYYEPAKKVMKINQLASKRLSDYVGTVNAVFFSPDDLNIIKKSPGDRRRFLDLLIAQVKPAHIFLLNTYYKIIKQKNYLLKKERDVKLLKEQLQAWNQQLSEAGCKIIKNRGIFTENLNRHSQLIFQKIFKGGFFLDLHYMPLGQKDIDQALKLFPEILESKMQTEIEKKSVLIGPHRDDLLINLNGKEAKQYASQGQQRAIVLSLKLAEMEIIINEKGDCPILLLDDVSSELDEYRRDYLIDYINCTEKQTILTMTAVDNKITAKNKTVYNVNQGTIRREG